MKKKLTKSIVCKRCKTRVCEFTSRRSGDLIGYDGDEEIYQADLDKTRAMQHCELKRRRAQR